MHDRHDTTHGGLPDQGTVDDDIEKARAPSSFFLGYGKSEVMEQPPSQQNDPVTRTKNIASKFFNSMLGDYPKQVDVNMKFKDAIGVTTVISQSFSEVIRVLNAQDNLKLFATRSQHQILATYFPVLMSTITQVTHDDAYAAMFEGVKMLIDCCNKLLEPRYQDTLKRIHAGVEYKHPLLNIMRYLKSKHEQVTTSSGSGGI